MYKKKEKPVRDMERIDLRQQNEDIAEESESEGDSEASEIEEQSSEYDTDTSDDKEISRSDAADILPVNGPVMTRRGRCIGVPLKYRECSC